jgi:hypothetical protein
MSTVEDPWSLIRSKRYAEAVDAYSRQYADGGGTFSLRGRAMTVRSYSWEFAIGISASPERQSARGEKVILPPTRMPPEA